MQHPSPEMQQWFSSQTWKENWVPAPDQSINLAWFHKHYHQRSGLWETVFRFLASADLGKMETGVYPIAGNEAYAMVSEYTTKPIQEARFEAHRKYIDLQYLVLGKERIGLAETSKGIILEPYSEEKDVEFYHPMDGHILEAHPGVFFIFFPEDAHQPCIADGTPSVVKKVVVKIAL
ncbi:MAG: YhcH/YjgK/YiaL family protein [Bacteroidales bacterium]